jgi:hypothetical protein
MDQNNMTVVAHHRVLLCLQPTAETQYSQLSLPVAVVVADRGSLVHQVQWTTEEPAAELVLVAVVDQTQETVLIAASVIMAVGALMVKDILVDQVLDLMWIQKTHTKEVQVVVQVGLVQVLLMVDNDIDRHLGEIKFQAGLVVQQIY